MDTLTRFLLGVFVGMCLTLGIQGFITLSRMRKQKAKQKKPRSAAARALADLLDHEAIQEHMGRLWGDAANIETFVSQVNKERGKGIYRLPDKECGSSLFYYKGILLVSTCARALIAPTPDTALPDDLGVAEKWDECLYLPEDAKGPWKEVLEEVLVEFGEQVKMALAAYFESKRESLEQQEREQQEHWKQLEKAWSKVSGGEKNDA